MTTPDDSILRKIRKCLALAASDVPGEAEAAMRQAQKLMAAHGIDQGTLARAEIGETRVQGTRGAAPAKWETYLAQTCCRAFGADFLWAGGPKGGWRKEHNGHLIFIGPRTSIELVGYAYAVLSRQVVKARAQYVAEHAWGAGTRNAKAAEGDAYAEAYVQRLYRKIMATQLSPELLAALKEVVKERVGDREPYKERGHGHEGSAYASRQGWEDGADAQFYAATQGPEELKKLEGNRS